MEYPVECKRIGLEQNVHRNASLQQAVRGMPSVLVVKGHVCDVSLFEALRGVTPNAFSGASVMRCQHQLSPLLEALVYKRRTPYPN